MSRDPKLDLPNPDLEVGKTLRMVETAIDHKALREMLDRLDKDGDPYQFVRGQGDYISLELWIHGTETVHTVELRPDGTWVARTRVEI